MTNQQLSIDQAMALAKKHAKNGQNATARDIYKRILAQQPDHAGAKRGLKKLPHNAKDKNNFRTDMERLTVIYESGKDEEALTLATKLSRKYKTQPMPQNIKGVVLLRSGRLDEAIATFQSAIDLEPTYPDLWSNLGMAFELADRPEDAKRCFQRLLTLAPNSVPAMSHLGLLFRSEGDPERAANYYERAIEIAPENIDVLIGYGATLRQLGHENSSLELLRSAIDLQPENAIAHREFGETLNQKKLYTASLEHLRTAISLDSDDPVSQFQLGMALLLLGEFEDAERHLETCIALSPGLLPSAEHFLAVAKGERTDVAPEAYIKSLFDEYATRFENSLVMKLGYRGPGALTDLLDQTVGAREFKRAVDLGCGTGLMGSLVRDRVGWLAGVDLSPRMLKKADEKGVYDELIAGELVASIDSLDYSPDLLLCADVLVYIGDLLPLFEAIKRRADGGAVFAFSTEKLDSGDYELLQTGRYAHSDAYIKRTAKSTGLEIISSEEGPLRRENQEWLTGGYYVLRKP